MTAAGRVAEGPADAPLTVALAHGAGAGMDTPFLDAFAAGLAAGGFRVVRFEFPYMAARRTGAARRPPDRAPVLEAAFETVARELGTGRLVVAGKSMGGRIASQVCDRLGARGLVCLGYPFHPPGRPERPRVEHLAELRTPALILQGTRDPFGGQAEVAGYRLSPRIRIVWVEDGNHDLVPRRSSGQSSAEAWRRGCARVVEFLGTLTNSKERS